MAMRVSEARAITGGLGEPSKMPGLAYGLPAAECHVGGALREIPGSVCEGCYAEKNRYAMQNVQDAQYGRLESLTDPRWVDAMVLLISRAPVGRGEYFRWHDSGDLQDLFHLILIVEVCERLPQVKFWLPTREKALVLAYLRAFGPFPANLVVRISAAMVDGTAPDCELPTSGVHRHAEPVGYACPAKALYDNTCGPCRACWDGAVPHVSYPWH